ncbi:MAPEG family protein [Azospirillum sp. ST 5-10]|uniref:MAPEG family protein n=1 Tax=unclassified Azospirillum TaxID=2630922 RepID=UPI003F49DB4F
MAADRRVLPVAAAVNLGAVAVTLALLAVLAPLFPPPAEADRLALAARLSLWPAAVLFAMAVGVMAARGRHLALNPIDDPESRSYRVAQRTLTNSVEQTSVFLPGLWALAATMPADRLGLPALFVALFVAGRLLFWAGYHVHPYARAPGMAMSFTVSAVVLGWAVALALGWVA